MGLQTLTNSGLKVLVYEDRLHAGLDMRSVVEQSEQLEVIRRCERVPAEPEALKSPSFLYIRFLDSAWRRLFTWWTRKMVQGGRSRIISRMSSFRRSRIRAIVVS